MDGGRPVAHVGGLPCSLVMDDDPPLAGTQPRLIDSSINLILGPQVQLGPRMVENKPFYLLGCDKMAAVRRAPGSLEEQEVAAASLNTSRLGVREFRCRDA